MNIPLDELYNFLTSEMADDTLIYHFQQHGSRNLQDLTQLNNNSTLQKACFMIIHDQEPLMPSFYNHDYLSRHAASWYHKNFGDRTAALLDIPQWREHVYDSNLAFVRLGLTDYDHNILVHSELRSKELQFYQDLGFETVYWWSHAMIALDWYRYARHDPLLSRPRQPKTLFNIYARAWHYPREYRLKLLDHVLDLDLQSHCRVKFNPWDQERHYSQYQYHNLAMHVHHDLGVFDSPATDSSASASYSALDYHDAWFDVVLETLFDDDRLHLTEKILRPIACGTPFVLCGTQGSLAYLRSYGFQTFHDIIDESYDDVKDPSQRLAAIASTMQDIHNRRLMHDITTRQKIHDICDHNRRRFFSNEFTQFVLDEFQNNYRGARDRCEQHRLGQKRNQLLDLMAQRSMIPSQSGDRSC